MLSRVHFASVVCLVASLAAPRFVVGQPIEQRAPVRRPVEAAPRLPGEPRRAALRIDPFSPLYDGTFPIAGEVRLTRALTAQAAPGFLVNSTPWEKSDLNHSAYQGEVTRESNGLGPLVGGGVDIGYWLYGRAFAGYVIRAGYAVHGFTYRSAAGSRPVDAVNYTQHRLVLAWGRHWLFRWFTLGAEFGLSFELNALRRCYLRGPENPPSTSSADCKYGQFEILVPTGYVTNFFETQTILEPRNINSSFHPLNLVLRTGLGIAF